MSRQPTIDSHPMDPEPCVVCGHVFGHPAGGWDPDGFCRICHCGHPDWEPGTTDG